MSRNEADRPAGHLKWYVIGGAATIAGLAIGWWMWPASDSEVPRAAAPSRTAPQPQPTTIPGILEQGVRADISAARSTDITLTGVRVADGTPFDFPAGMKVVYLRLGVREHKLGLLEQANLLGSKFMRRAFPMSPDIVAVYIDVVGPVPDRYGHLYDAPWITLVMDRRTFTKIEWAGFDSGNLCEFLSHEHVFDSESRTFCGTKGEL